MNTEELYALATTIAALLTTRGPWTVVPSEDRFPSVLSDEGPKFWINIDSSKRQLAINAHYPTADGIESYPRLEDRAPGINIGYAKSPRQIAADIERRFLPAFLIAWDKEAKAVHERNEYQAKRLANIERVARETCGNIKRDEYDKTRVSIDWRTPNYDNGYVVNVQVSATGVTMEIRGSVPIDIGIAILNLVHYQRTSI